ncbi:hypothetical protein PIB30_044158, partial [Stylosanthes scabra]|nr:hypothetical protein [Stylosanthes scabra]
MAKKKSCQNVRVPRVLSVAERELYGWVDREIFTQPLVVEADTLPELRREMMLTVNRAAEGDYVLEAAGPSDRLPFRALEDRTHYLWVYTKLFTRLGIRLPFTDFQREVLSRCRVADSQLHLNGWVFFAPLSGCACILASARHGAFFSTPTNFTLLPPEKDSCPSVPTKVLPLPGKRPFWLDDEGAPFPWVYWNAEVGDFRVTALDPLEAFAFEFLQSLPAGLGKKSNFKCRWILDHNDADVGAFLEDEGGRRGGSSLYPSIVQGLNDCFRRLGLRPCCASLHSGYFSSSSSFLRQKRRKQKASEASAEEAALGGDSAWKHKVNAIDRAFPPDYNFLAALDAGLTNGLTREILGPLVPEQLLGTAQFLACQLTACFQVGVENTFAAKVQLERAEGERLSATERMEEVERKAKVQAAELESCRSALATTRNAPVTGGITGGFWGG